MAKFELLWFKELVWTNILLLVSIIHFYTPNLFCEMSIIVSINYLLISFLCCVIHIAHNNFVSMHCLNASFYTQEKFKMLFFYLLKIRYFISSYIQGRRLNDNGTSFFIKTIAKWWLLTSCSLSVIKRSCKTCYCVTFE